jgi:hypothetical protein
MLTLSRITVHSCNVTFKRAPLPAPSVLTVAKVLLLLTDTTMTAWQKYGVVAYQTVSITSQEAVRCAFRFPASTRLAAACGHSTDWNGLQSEAYKYWGVRLSASMVIPSVNLSSPQ